MGNLCNDLQFEGMSRAKRQTSGAMVAFAVSERLFGLALRSRFSECQSALKAGDVWCPPKPLGSSPGAPGESIEEPFLAHVEPLFWSQIFTQKLPVLGAERPSVPELLRVVVETMFEILLNNDFSCFSKCWGCKVAEFTMVCGDFAVSVDHCVGDIGRTF